MEDFNAHKNLLKEKFTSFDQSLIFNFQFIEDHSGKLIIEDLTHNLSKEAVFNLKLQADECLLQIVPNDFYFSFAAFVSNELEDEINRIIKLLKESLLAVPNH